MKIKVTKIESILENHPIEKGFEYIGNHVDDPIVGHEFYAKHLTKDTYLRTSRVKKVNDDGTFETKNSIYKIEKVMDSERCYEAMGEKADYKQAKDTLRKEFEGTHDGMEPDFLPATYDDWLEDKVIEHKHLLFGKGVLHAKTQSRIKELETKLHEISEEYIGMDGFEAKTAPEAYQQSLLKRIYDIAIR